MTTLEQEDLLLGLRTEVLELKEILADNYYDKSQLSKIYISDDDLSSTLSSYLTSDEINKKYKKITASDKRDDELEKRINDCALSSQLDDYVTLTDFNDYKSSMNGEIESLEKSVNHNSEYIKSFYTKDEIDSMGFITELPSLDYLASIEWVESKGYLTEHQSLSGYATINWVKSQLDSNKINLDAYAKLSNIPKRTSDLINDSGYLTEHQSLSDYAKIDDINAIEKEVFNIKNTFNSYVKNNVYITIKDVESYIGLLNLDGTYAKKSEIDEILENFDNYSTNADLSIVKGSILKIREDLKDYSTHDYVKEYVDGLNLDGTYAKKSEISSLEQSLKQYAKVDYVESKYAKKSEIPDISLYYNADYINDTFETKASLESLISNYALSSDVDELDKSIQDKLNNYAKLTYVNKFKSYCNDVYAKKTDIDDCNEKIDKITETASNIDSSLTNYLKKSDANNYYVTKSEFEKINSFVTEVDVTSIVDDKMSSYATITELEDCTSVTSKLVDFASNAKERLLKIENKLGDFAEEEYVNNKLDELKTLFISSDELDAYITKADATSLYDSKLSEYAKKVDIGNLISYSEVDKNYLKKNEINSYIPNLSLYVKKTDLNDIKSNIEELTTDILDNIGKTEIINQKLSSNYFTKTEVGTEISKIYSDLTTNLSKYAKKSDIPKDVDLSPYAKIAYVDRISNELVNYAKLADMPDVTNCVKTNEYNDDIAGIYSYIDEKTDTVLLDYVTESDLSSKLTKVTNSLVTKKELDEKLSYYSTKSSLDNYMDTYISEKLGGIVKQYINSQLNVYLSKREAEDTYLAIEDYKYLKNAAVIDDSYKNKYEEFYYSLFDKDGNPLDNVRLHNGFYIVGDQLCFVYNGKLMKLDMIEYWKEEEQ